MAMDPVNSRPDGRSDAKPIEALFEQVYRRTIELEGRSTLPLREWVDRAEAWRIVQALREYRGNRSAAARVLGIGRRTLYSKMERLGVGLAWEMARTAAAHAPDAPGAALAAAPPGDLESAT
jgi:DNA-binding NtrC family response regulator